MKPMNLTVAVQTAVHTTTRTHSPVWTARCKSGYQYRTANGKLRTCKQSTSRGELLCSDCAAAVIDTDALRMERPGIVARVKRAVDSVRAEVRVHRAVTAYVRGLQTVGVK